MSDDKVKASWDELPDFTDLGGTLRIFGESLGLKDMELVVGKFSPGEGLKPHIHRSPTEEIYYIYRGKITVHVGDKTYHAEAGDALRVPPDVVHYPLNESDEDCWAIFVLSSPQTAAPVLASDTE